MKSMAVKDTINKVNTDGKSGKCHTKTPDKKLRSCKFCGKSHIWDRTKCPAFGKKCSKCGKLNHFASKCKMRRVKGKTVAYVHESHVDESSDDSEWIGKVEDEQQNDLKCKMKINNQVIVFNIDTGATVNTIPVRYASNLRREEKTLTMWDGSQLKTYGVTKEVVYNPANGKYHDLQFVVTKNDRIPLIGYQDLKRLSLIHVNEHNIERVALVQLEDFQLVFNKTSIGNLPGTVALVANAEVKPVIMPTR
ncbi:uncharacterized protein LOC117111043 [Anneissia japonica]|uniref:uncharacterized protein LOC117111043 n=1 Tax=Anneissia japonica TaxID=1529436 RepID=UPI001425631B|nr:uncharacterized protein LOC117111043 [Anneissia japonica]